MFHFFNEPYHIMMEISMRKNFLMRLVLLTALLLQITDSTYHSYRYQYYRNSYYNYRYYRYFNYNTYYYTRTRYPIQNFDYTTIIPGYYYNSIGDSNGAGLRMAVVAGSVVISCILFGLCLIVACSCGRRRQISPGTVLMQPIHTAPYTITGAMTYTQPMPPPECSTLGPTPIQNMSSTQNIQQLSAQNMRQTNGTMLEPLSTDVMPPPPCANLPHKEYD